MTDPRPSFVLHPAPVAIVRALLPRAFIGCIVAFGTALLLFHVPVADGFWMIPLILIALFALQLAGHGILPLIAWGIAAPRASVRERLLTQRQPSLPSPPTRPAEAGPWLTLHAASPTQWPVPAVLPVQAGRTGVLTEGLP